MGVRDTATRSEFQQALSLAPNETTLRSPSQFSPRGWTAGNVQANGLPCSSVAKLPIRFTLRSLSTKYYRSVSRCYLDEIVSPTVFVGRNNVGKSNAVDILKFLKDASEDLSSALQSRGNSVTDIILKKPLGGRGLEAEVVFAVDDSDRTNFLSTFCTKMPPERSEMLLETNLLRFVRYYLTLRADSGEQEIAVSAPTKEGVPIRLVAEQWRGYQHTVENTAVETIIQRWDQGTSPIQGVYNPMMSGGESPKRLIFPSDWEPPEPESPDLIKAVREVLSHTTWLGPSLRSEPKLDAQETTILDTEAGNLVTALHTLKNNDPGKFRILEEVVKTIVPNLGGFLTPVTGTNVTFSIGDPAGDLDIAYTLEQLSFGTKRVLAMVAACLLTPDGGILVVEEPESNIHPHAQEQLVRYLLSQSNRINIFLTTHSPVVASLVPLKSLQLVTSGGTGEGVVTQMTEDRVPMLIDELGIRPSFSFEADALCFVEGETDVPGYRAFANRLGIGPELEFVNMGGGSNAQYMANARVLKTRKLPLDVTVILDGDRIRGKDPAAATKAILDQLEIPRENALILSTSELEGFLLEPRAIIEAYPKIRTTEQEIAVLIGSPPGKRDQKGILDRVRAALEIDDSDGEVVRKLAEKTSQVPPEVQRFLASIKERISRRKSTGS